ncbi:unnamed protein product [Cuscuta campestris]|uniref:MI domain-containing protein n=1 Tax=Cuscuta campestris TaxID=132261 RepID=A0A484NKK3_9ASTE|nr:unnamed protein product [Cuscuta campestris]
MDNEPLTRGEFDEYKKKVTVILQEYFENDDKSSTASELRELGMPFFSFYFVKKLVSMAMDRHDKEKEMAALLLSSLYAHLIQPSQVYKGFAKLLESVDDLIVDIPDAVDVLALFIARAVVDDILPPAFLSKSAASLPPENRNGVEVINRAGKSYLSAPLHAEVIERRWGGSRGRTVEDLKGKINGLLKEYAVSGDKKEAFRIIKDLNVPYFHHEIVKRSVIASMERPQDEARVFDLLKTAAEQGLINSSQISKGFGRIIESVDDLSLDIPNAKAILQLRISRAASDGWLSASSLPPIFPTHSGHQNAPDPAALSHFKTKAQSMIQEYFLTGDISEVSRCLESENGSCSPELNAIFIKKLVGLAMDRKNREKEMASVLLSSLCFPTDDAVSGFTMLIEAADDTALDIPAAAENLAMFLARAVVDEVLAPQHLEEIGIRLQGAGNTTRVVETARSLLGAKMSGERILRCWGGGGSGAGNGWTTTEDVKEKMKILLEEFESGGDSREARRCIKELGMPFFHHEVVKKGVVMMMEKKGCEERVWGLLRECFGTGLVVTVNQMTKGFVRVGESLDDLVLDVPDAREQYRCYVDRAKMEGWLDASFTYIANS